MTDNLSDSFNNIAAQMQGAIQRAAVKLAVNLENALKVQIASAGLGNFFMQAMHVTVSVSGQSISIQIMNDVPYFGVFDKNTVIHGKPYLWVPLSFANKTRISQYKGKLVFVQRLAGKPLMIDADTHIPVFVGLDSVQIKKRLDIQGAIDGELTKFGDLITAEL